MRKLVSLLFVIGFVFTLHGQNASSIFTTGLNESNRFAKGYLQPGAEAMVYSMHNGWFNSGQVKPFLGFEISVIGNIAVVPEEKRTFVYTPDVSSGLSFSDGSIIKNVSSVLGDMGGDVEMLLTVEGPDGSTEEVPVTLPESITGSNVMNIPSGYIQGSIGLLKATELKLRILPGIEINGQRIGLVGAGVQHEFTKWLPADKLWPVAVSGLVAYSRLDANYDMEDVINTPGTDKLFVNNTDSWLFQLLASTKLPVINFYGGIGYLAATSYSQLKGRYQVYKGSGVTVTVVNPISVSNKVSGVRATLGTRLKLGFFRLNAEYSFAEFNTASVGVSFGFR